MIFLVFIYPNDAIYDVVDNYDDKGLIYYGD